MSARRRAACGPMSLRRALGTLSAALLAAMVLIGAGEALPAPPLGSAAELRSWWQAAGPAQAVFCLVRLAGVTLSGYLALLGLLGTIAALTRWSWAHALLVRSASPGMRRLLIGGGLAAGMSMSTVGAATSPTVFDLVDVGTAAVEFELLDVGPSPIDQSTRPVDAQSPPTPRAAPAPAEEEPVPEGPSIPSEPVEITWEVVPGDHLWSIAARTVFDRSGDDSDATIASYWRRLIEHNRDAIGENPDLIHPGQLIRLPR